MTSTFGLLHLYSYTIKQQIKNSYIFWLSHFIFFLRNLIDQMWWLRVTELILSLLGSGYAGYYSIKCKTYKYAYVVVDILCIQLTKKPFHIQKKQSLAILALIFGLIHLYQFSIRQKIKDAFVYPLIFLILGLALVFLK